MKSKSMTYFIGPGEMEEHFWLAVSWDWRKKVGAYAIAGYKNCNLLTHSQKHENPLWKSDFHFREAIFNDLCNFLLSNEIKNPIVYQNNLAIVQRIGHARMGHSYKDPETGIEAIIYKRVRDRPEYSFLHRKTEELGRFKPYRIAVSIVKKTLVQDETEDDGNPYDIPNCR